MKLFWNRADQANWDSFSALPLQQSWAYGQAAGNALRVEIIANGMHGQAQLLVRGGRFGGVALLSRGPIWDCPVPKQLERTALRAIRAGLPGATPLIITSEHQTQGMPLMSGASVAEVPLGPTEEMRARLSGKWRNRLVRAGGVGVCVEQADPGGKALDWLCAKDRAQQKSRGYRGLPQGFYTSWPDRKCLLTARGQDGGIIAAMLMLRHGSVVSYQIGWSSPKGRKLNAHNLLLWAAMVRFAEQGCERLDLGMVDTVNAPGLARFKLGSGAGLRKLGPTCLLLPRFRSGLATRARSPEMQSKLQPSRHPQ